MTAIVLLVAALGAFACGGALSALLRRRPALSAAVGAGGAVAGGLLGAAAGALGLAGGPPATLSLPWELPGAELALSIDGLAAFFIIPVSLVTALAAFYTPAYVRRGRFSWFWFDALGAAMLLVLAAANGLLFLIAWEVMSLASFFLVMTHGEDEGTLRAGWTYLVATHIGTAFLLAYFLLLDRGHGGLAAADGAPAGVLFALALAGFGTKAGFVPAHVWLPEAHPAAPSPVSAVMSGVMIKTGLYGILRTVTLLGGVQPWWGWALLAIGAVSGILGVVYALAQHDLKRLLAYHSVENMGIIALGIGLGLLGLSYRLPALAAFGFCGALLHVLNHALFKSLLFLGAGSVDAATGTRELDRLGGLLKVMPVTGATFLVGAAAIAGLPPLNGFASELLIALAAFRGVVPVGALVPAIAAAGLAVIAALALIGGLAAACFAKAFGIVFLGEPREPEIRAAGEAPWTMLLPMVLLALACAGVGLAAPIVVRALRAPLELLLGVVGPVAPAPAAPWADLTRPLAGVSIAGAVLLALIAVFALVRRAALAGKEVRRGPTWDCGYLAPTPRMQYTAASFAQAITDAFRPLLGGGPRIKRPEGPFPGASGLHTEPKDPFLHKLFSPLFAAVAWAASRLRPLQQATIQVYILYIAATVLVLLVWKLR